MGGALFEVRIVSPPRWVSDHGNSLTLCYLPLPRDEHCISSPSLHIWAICTVPCCALNYTWSVRKFSSVLLFGVRWSAKGLSFFLQFFWKEIYKGRRSWVSRFFPTHFLGICEYNTQFLECNVTTLFRSCSSLCFSHLHIYHAAIQARAFVGLHCRCPDVAGSAGAVYTDPPSCSDHLRLIRSPIWRLVEPRSQNWIRCSSRDLLPFFTSTFAQLVHRHCW